MRMGLRLRIVVEVRTQERRGRISRIVSPRRPIVAVPPPAYDANVSSIRTERRRTVDSSDPGTEGPLDAEALFAHLRELSTEELAATFRKLDTLQSTTEAHRLIVLAVLDERCVGREDGTLDTVGWVTWTSRLSRARARALVETARALPERPRLTTVALEGRLSSEQLEAAVQVASAETDAEWAETAPGWSRVAERRGEERPGGDTRGGGRAGSGPSADVLLGRTARTPAAARLAPGLRRRDRGSRAGGGRGADAADRR
jgi:hypothetical protein